jgi:hypothetical protein
MSAPCCSIVARVWFWWSVKALLRPGGAGAALGQLRRKRPVQQGDVQLVGHHRRDADAVLVGLGEGCAELRFGRIGQPVMDAPVDAVVIDGRAARRQVAQHVAPGVVPILDEVELGTLEGHAIETPDPQAVARPRCGVVLRQRCADRDELADVGFLARALPVARGGALRAANDAKHGGPLGSQWAHSCAPRCAAPGSGCAPPA